MENCNLFLMTAIQRISDLKKKGFKLELVSFKKIDNQRVKIGVTLSEGVESVFEILASGGVYVLENVASRPIFLLEDIIDYLLISVDENVLSEILTSPLDNQPVIIPT